MQNLSLQGAGLVPKIEEGGLGEEAPKLSTGPVKGRFLFVALSAALALFVGRALSFVWGWDADRFEEILLHSSAGPSFLVGFQAQAYVGLALGWAAVFPWRARDPRSFLLLSALAAALTFLFAAGVSVWRTLLLEEPLSFALSVWDSQSFLVYATGLWLAYLARRGRLLIFAFGFPQLAVAAYWWSRMPPPFDALDELSSDLVEWALAGSVYLLLSWARDRFRREAEVVAH